MSVVHDRTMDWKRMFVGKNIFLLKKKEKNS